MATTVPPPLQNNHATPAQVRYYKITGSTKDKFKRLDEIEKLADIAWQECPDDWQAPFLPRGGNAKYWEMPLLTDLFPWQHSGSQFKRAWPIGETRELLRARWATFTAGDLAARKTMFKDKARTVQKIARDVITGEALPTLASMPTIAADAPIDQFPAIERYAFRSFDHQFCFSDARFNERPRPPLWKSYGPRQVFLTGMMSEIYGDGPALTATPYIPDLHHFSGRGGKDIIPLWRDAEATQANVTAGLLEYLSALYGQTVATVDLFAAVYALLFPRAYVERFADELLIPGPRVPLPTDFKLFERAAELGHQLIRLHTWGERDLQSNETSGEIAQGTATYDVAPSPEPKDYPKTYAYDANARKLRVGQTGEWNNVTPDAWDYSVSGLPVVESWLKYRMLEATGRKSSPLDEIRPAFWSAEMSSELTELLWTLEGSLALEPQCAALLQEVMSGELVGANDLPAPTAAERKAPGDDDEEDEQLEMLTEET